MEMSDFTWQDNKFINVCSYLRSYAFHIILVVMKLNRLFKTLEVKHLIKFINIMDWFVFGINSYKFKQTF